MCVICTYVCNILRMNLGPGGKEYFQNVGRMGNDKRVFKQFSGFSEVWGAKSIIGRQMAPLPPCTALIFICTEELHCP